MYAIQVLQALGEGRHHHAKVWEAAEQMFVANAHDRRVFEELLERALESGVMVQHNTGASRQYELVPPTGSTTKPPQPKPEEIEEND